MDLKPMKIAMREAESGVNLLHGGPFGAVVTYEGRIIGRGHNRVIISNDPTAHAEIEAIRSACRHLGTFNLSGAHLYTTCYPCPMCIGAILWSRIEKVYYCISSEDVAEIGFDDDRFHKIVRDTEHLDRIFILDEAEKNACINLLRYYIESPHQTY